MLNKAHMHKMDGHATAHWHIKASQSFAPAGAKAVWIIFSGGMYAGKNTLWPASVQAERVRAAGCKPFAEKAAGIFGSFMGGHPTAHVP